MSVKYWDICSCQIWTNKNKRVNDWWKRNPCTWNEYVRGAFVLLHNRWEPDNRSCPRTKNVLWNQKEPPLAASWHPPCVRVCVRTWKSCFCWRRNFKILIYLSVRGSFPKLMHSFSFPLAVFSGNVCFTTWGSHRRPVWWHVFFSTPLLLTPRKGKKLYSNSAFHKYGFCGPDLDLHGARPWVVGWAGAGRGQCLEAWADGGNEQPQNMDQRTKEMQLKKLYCLFLFLVIRVLCIVWLRGRWIKVCFLSKSSSEANII